MLSPVMTVKDIELPGEALLRRFDHDILAPERKGILEASLK